jgi:hypothetical protein
MPLRNKVAASCLVLALLTTPLHSQTLSIRVHSHWIGWGSKTSDVTISGDDGVYRSHGHQVGGKFVKQFLDTLEEPALLKPSLANCGIDEAWLKLNADTAFKEITYKKINDLIPEPLELFRSRFTNKDEAHRAFEKLYEQGHTDDYPDMTIEITTENKAAIHLQSDSQFPFMLPWKGYRGGGYNCRLSLALGKLLTSNITNQERLLRIT